MVIVSAFNSDCSCITPINQWMELPINPKRRAQIDVRNGEVVDRISNLPEDVISRILSLMPTKFAVRTSILSNRWKYLWTSITNLDFEHHARLKSSFIDFIDRVLHLCKTSQIQLFRLSCYNYPNSGLSVDKLISEAIRLHATEIVIDVFGQSVPMSVFGCVDLTALEIYSFGSDMPSSVCFPNLKILSISKVDEDMLQKIICGCPILEDLSFTGIITNQKKFVVNITTLTMKRLTFRPCLLVDKRTEIVIHAPNLECLHISNIINLRLEKLQSLVEANLHLSYYDSDGLYEDWDRKSKRDHVIDLLREISGVKSLSLYFDAHNMTVMEFLHDTKLPIFHYLTHLKMIFVDYNCCQFLPLLLECSPNLEYLYLAKASWFDKFIVQLPFLSGCSLLHLGEIVLNGFKGKKDDLPVVEYLLKSAKVLKQLIIISDRSTLEKEREFYNKLLELSKAASTCKIEFHGRHLQIPNLQIFRQTLLNAKHFMSKVSLEGNDRANKTVLPLGLFSQQISHFRNEIFIYFEKGKSKILSINQLLVQTT